MRVSYMMGGNVIAERQHVLLLPKVGDRQYLRDVREDPFQVKYWLLPIPGFDLAIVGLEDIE